jgi:hypothetical protein
MKNCKFCSNPFEPHHHNDKYCSPECKRKSWKISKINYKKTEKGKASIRRWCRNEKFKLGQKKYLAKPETKKIKCLATKRFRKTEKGKMAHRFDTIQQKSLKRNPNAGRLDWKAWLAKLERLGNKCLCCGASNPTIDHIVPLSPPHNGTNHIDNLQPLCNSCNRKKGTKVIRYG